jgi:O-acetylserine/cysteine efflux transporter
MVAPFLLILPVFTVVGSIVFLSERLTPHVLIGGLIVIAGVAFVLVEKQPAVAGVAD